MEIRRRLDEVGQRKASVLGIAQVVVPVVRADRHATQLSAALWLRVQELRARRDRLDVVDDELAAVESAADLVQTWRQRSQLSHQLPPAVQTAAPDEVRPDVLVLNVQLAKFEEDEAENVVGERGEERGWRWFRPERAVAGLRRLQ